jgi:hypothetical protein
LTIIKKKRYEEINGFMGFNLSGNGMCQSANDSADGQLPAVEHWNV